MSSLSSSEIDGRYSHCFSPKIDVIKAHQEGLHAKNIHEIYEAIFKGGILCLTPAVVPVKRGLFLCPLVV